MRDLTSLKDGIPNKFENGHINFEVFKTRLLIKIFLNVQF